MEREKKNIEKMWKTDRIWQKKTSNHFVKCENYWFRLSQSSVEIARISVRAAVISQNSLTHWREKNIALGYIYWAWLRIPRLKHCHWLSNVHSIGPTTHLLCFFRYSFFFLFILRKIQKRTAKNYKKKKIPTDC